jgi:hypothetical protein
MPELKSAFMGELKIAVTGTYMLGEGPQGRRRIDLLSKGSFEGPRIKAKIVPGGVDLLLAGSDGAVRPDVRLLLELDDGKPLLIVYRGVRAGTPEVMARIAAGELVPRDEYYHRTAMTFETASPKYDWLNRIVAVGVGRREPEFAIYEVFEVL